MVMNDGKFSLPGKLLNTEGMMRRISRIRAWREGTRKSDRGRGERMRRGRRCAARDQKFT